MKNSGQRTFARPEGPTDRRDKLGTDEWIIFQAAGKIYKNTPCRVPECSTFFFLKKPAWFNAACKKLQYSRSVLGLDEWLKGMTSLNWPSNMSPCWWLEGYLVISCEMSFMSPSTESRVSSGEDSSLCTLKESESEENSWQEWAISYAVSSLSPKHEANILEFKHLIVCRKRFSAE